MESIPVTILGGSDRRPGPLPPSGASLHALSTYKGLAIRIGGRALIELLLERVAATPGLGPVSIAGPARVYEPLGLPARLVDTDASVAGNLRAAIEAGPRSAHGDLAILACDVLPSLAELAELRERFEAAPPCSLWFPFVPVPEDRSALGAFAYKPVYRVVPRDGGQAVPILPGHLGIFDPDALRLPLLYRLMDRTYQSRNHSVRYRRAVLLRTALLSLLAQDLLLLARLKAPTRTLTIVSSGLRLAARLRRGPIELVELERLIGRIFLRAHVPLERGMHFELLDALGLAADADTEEEADQLSRE
jgi:hypothetical protein